MTNNPIVPEVVALLRQILSALETSAQPAVVEGFSDYSKTVFCNLTKGNGDGWYQLEDGFAITQLPRFTGRVLKLSFPTLERNGQAVRKFHLTMQAKGRITTFESGYDCFFSKTVMAACAAASPAVLAAPIQLNSYVKELRTGDKTLAVSLRSASSGVVLPSEWRNDDDWNEIANAAISNVSIANS